MICTVLVSTLIVLVYARTAVHPPLPKLDGRIVGGVDATIEEYPYQLSLELIPYDMHVCGASLIRPNVALTAAHCTKGWTSKDFKIRAGSSYRHSGGELVDVISICEHPKYTPYDYDVSVLYLSRSLPLGAGIQTISLQPMGREIPDRTVAVVTGWGVLSVGGSSPLRLQAVEVPKVSRNNCQKSYPSYNITDRMTCYGYTEGGKDACQGDSGGPLVVNGKQVGIVSWGIGCASPNYPGVHAKVSDEEVSNHIKSCLKFFRI